MWRARHLSFFKLSCPTTSPAGAFAPVKAPHRSGRLRISNDGGTERACGRRAWHPDFPLAALTVPGLERAVEEAAAAQQCERARARAAKRRRGAPAAAGQDGGEAAAPAYAPSGVFAGGAADEEAAEGPGGEEGPGTGAAGAGAAGAGAPRPPQLLRRHEPCKDTTPMDTEAFLVHLRTLSWYRDQARALPCSRAAWSPPSEGCLPSVAPCRLRRARAPGGQPVGVEQLAERVPGGGGPRRDKTRQEMYTL